jgi:hypothetical protein
MVNTWGQSWGASSAWGVSWGQSEAPALADRGVVLFPPEALRFRSRWDKTMYGWSCLVRDMRAPVAGFRPMTDHYVSAVALAAR